MDSAPPVETRRWALLSMKSASIGYYARNGIWYAEAFDSLSALLRRVERLVRRGIEIRDVDIRSP